jgi:glutaredoxin 3
MRIVIYSKGGCPNCVTAKRLLDDKGIGYEEVNAETMTHAERERWFGGIRKMPQIWIEGQRVGGLAGLQQALKELGL